ncbi:ATP-dependent DNA ligase [Ramlibacter sp. AN1133]|uniref:ATP-dependent DNA ligase n=1 Tax=Ramlibacter sp. AN1133 TaxID=3133429 RepID=UPI0030BE9362
MTPTIPAPMRATEGGRPFTSADWIYEIKYDGYRCLARAGAGQPVELRTKNGVECTKWFPEVADLLSTLPGGPHVIDGEVCVLDDIGRSDFERLQARARRRRWAPGADPVTFCAFDLLFSNGRSLMSLRLIERKEMLQQLLAPLRAKLVVVGDLPAQAELFQQAVLGAKLEGFVAKRRDSVYTPGVRSPHWLKIKRPGWQDGRTWRS